MAKGFTVKASAPVAANKELEWDYDLAREMVRGKSIVFCLPGRGVSYTYLKSFVQLCFDLVQNGASIQISQDYSSMVNFARCKCLGANVLRGPNQLPWDGKLNYDWQLWIDSDIVFNSEKFWQLVLMEKLHIFMIKQVRLGSLLLEQQTQQQIMTGLVFMNFQVIL